MKGIVLLGDEVQAIRDEGHVLIERAVKPHVKADSIYGCGVGFFTPEGKYSIRGVFDDVPGCEWFRKPPLWPDECRYVREAWDYADTSTSTLPVASYRAGGGPANSEPTWRSGATMPKWARRFDVVCKSITAKLVDGVVRWVIHLERNNEIRCGECGDVIREAQAIRGVCVGCACVLAEMNA